MIRPGPMGNYTGSGDNPYSDEPPGYNDREEADIPVRKQPLMLSPHHGMPQHDPYSFRGSAESLVGQVREV